MEIKKLEVLLKAAELGSITKAGEALGYTQSGVSHLLKTLEKELGFPLLRRTRTGVSLSEEGRILLPAILQIQQGSEQLEQRAAALRGLTRGKIRIGAFTSLSVGWLPEIIRLFQTRYSAVEIELIEGGDQFLACGLESGQIDIGFGRCPTESEADWIPLLEDCLLAVLPEQYLADTVFPVESFQHAPFIALPESFDQEVRDLFQSHGIEPDIRFSATDDYTIISLVEQGLGLSILPQLVLERYPHCRIRTVPLFPVCKRELGIVVPSLKNASPVVKKFVECTRESIQCARDETPE